ncbi:MAG TPA: DUF6089 family protein [Sphingobacteriaceae bacterium]
MRRVLLSFFLVCSSMIAPAQTWEVGGFAGSSGYMGDINPEKPYLFTDIAFGGQIKRNFDGYWSLRFNAVHGKIQASDAASSNEWQQQRNLDFYSPLTEVSLLTEFNFFKYHASLERKYSPYLFAGIGGAVFNPKTMLGGEEYQLQYYNTEGVTYRPYAIAIPYGAGIKYNITGNWNLAAEIGYRTAFSDYLDDVSTVYPDRTTLASPEARQLSDRSALSIPAGVQRGDFRKRDTYMFVGLSLSFTFVTQKCYF